MVLAELLPRECDGHLVGLPGLRFQLLRRNVELFLADAGPTVRVTVANTSYRQFAAAMTFATTVAGFTARPCDEPAPVSELEELTIALGRTPGPVALASALLRRRRAAYNSLVITQDLTSYSAGSPPVVRRSHVLLPFNPRACAASTQS